MHKFINVFERLNQLNLSIIWDQQNLPFFLHRCFRFSIVSFKILHWIERSVSFSATLHDDFSARSLGAGRRPDFGKPVFKVCGMEFYGK